MKFIKQFGIVIVTSLLTTSVIAAGGQPKGKPFVALQNDIVEVQSTISTLQEQVESLVTHVNDIEDRIGANETAITTLQLENNELQIQIDASGEDIETLQSQIDTLEEDNANLAALVANGGSSDDLQAQIDANAELISSLEQSIATISTFQNNATLIEILQEQVAHIQSVLDEQAALADGQCPHGELLIGYNAPTQTTLCQPITGSPSEVGYLQYHTISLLPGRTANAGLNCSEGNGIPSNLGWNQVGGIQFLGILRTATGYNISVRNISAMRQTITITLECRRYF
ncbi:MAG: hypothetical protein KAT25_01015 [Sulfuriflexus sp.]|nr:hypothetical protein [Sulfuriflexus sp.]